MQQNHLFYVNQLGFKVADLCDAAIRHDGLTEPKVRETLMDLATRYSPVETPDKEG